MSLFIDSFANHLSNELNVELEDVTKAINKFGIGNAKITEQIPITKQNLLDLNPVSKSTTSQISSSTGKEKHPCCRVKRGQTDTCGKSSTKCIGDKWYCGTLKSGCYSIMIKKAAENAISETSTQTSVKTKSKTTSKLSSTNAERKAVRDNISKQLIKKVTKQTEIRVVCIDTNDGTKLYYEKEHRILFDPKTDEAYGCLDDDNNTINELSDENIRWLESNNCSIRITKSSKTDDNFEEELEDDDFEEELEDDDLDESGDESE